MRRWTNKWVLALATGTALTAIASCDGGVTPANNAGSVAPLSFESRAGEFDISTGFTPLPGSSVCSVGGGLSQFVLPQGFAATLIAAEPSFPDNIDMNTVNETGIEPGRFLYRTHEVSRNAGVSVTDLETGETRIVAQRADWERFDGIVWTPWGTILAAEEINPSANNIPDPDFPAATAGLLYEIDPQSGAAHARPAVGVKSHEGARFDAQGNLYGISERAPGFIFKFVPDRPQDLSSGQLYALRLVQDLGDRTGPAEWVALDRAQVRINADAAAEAVQATGYARPEDVETGTSTGRDPHGNFLYVAATGEDRVLAIDLSAEPNGQAFVSDYVRDGVNAPADFDLPDNLALDKHGNLFIAEDPGGGAPTKTRGDDVWVTRPDLANPRQGQPVERFLSITDCEAEPTGIYFSKSGRSLFIDVQHRGGDGRDGAFAIQKLSQIDFTTTAR
jgi:secreted PhoX family phosphatase